MYFLEYKVKVSSFNKLHEFKGRDNASKYAWYVISHKRSNLNLTQFLYGH